MWILKKKKEEKKTNILIRKIDEIIQDIDKANVHELIYILGNKKEIVKRNFLAGIFRGIGIGIGVTIITAVLILVLQQIVMLNIPVIGEYISDIVDIVEKSR